MMTLIQILAVIIRRAIRMKKYVLNARMDIFFLDRKAALRVGIALQAIISLVMAPVLPATIHALNVPTLPLIVLLAAMDIDLLKTIALRTFRLWSQFVPLIVLFVLLLVSVFFVFLPFIFSQKQECVFLSVLLALIHSSRNVLLVVQNVEIVQELRITVLLAFRDSLTFSISA